MARKSPAQPLKFDSEKVRLELVPPEFILATGRGLTYGAKKYSAGNWATGDGFDWSRLAGGMKRHFTAWESGEDFDPESGNHHLDHAACMLAFLIAHIHRGHGKDDRVNIGTMPRKPLGSSRAAGKRAGSGRSAKAKNARHGRGEKASRAVRKRSTR